MTNPTNRELMLRLRVPAYAFLFATLVFQLFDYAAAQLPLRFDSVLWRFTALGSAANAIGNVLLLLLLIYALSLVTSDRIVITFVGVTCAFAALFLLAGGGVFTLDGLQIRASLDPGARTKFDLATWQALVKLVAEGVIAALFAFSAFRALSAMMRGDRTPDAPIFVHPSVLRAP